MEKSVGDYFNYRGRRYYRIYKSGLSRSRALSKVAGRRKEAPQFLWIIHREPDGNYSIGRSP